MFHHAFRGPVRSLPLGGNLEIRPSAGFGCVWRAWRLLECACAWLALHPQENHWTSFYFEHCSISWSFCAVFLQLCWAEGFWVLANFVVEGLLHHCSQHPWSSCLGIGTVMCDYVKKNQRFDSSKLSIMHFDNMDRWKAEMGRVREKRRVEERRWEKRKSQKKEDAGARKGRKVAKHCVFPMICGSGGSKSRLAKAAGAEPSGQMRDEKVHAVVARSTFRSPNVQNTPWSDHFWKLRSRKSAGGCCAKHISKSKSIKHTSFGRRRKSARCCGAKHISKSKCKKHQGLGPLLEVEMSQKCTPLWREAHFEVKMHKTPGVRTTFGGSDVVSLGRRKGLRTLSKVSKTWGFCSIFNYNHHYSLHHTTLQHTTLHYSYNYTCTAFHYTTLHYTPLHDTELHSITLYYATLHYITLHYTRLHYTTLHYTALHYTTLPSTTLHYITLHYTTLHSNTLQLQLHNYTPLH